MARKRSYHHGDLRRTLLDASLALIDEQGLAALSLREVARRAGVSHQAPYFHFADRAALLAALADEGFTLLHAAMKAEQARSPHGADAQLMAAGRGYVAFALEHPGHFRIMFRPELCAGMPPPPSGEAAYQLLVDGVAAAQDAHLAPAGERDTLVLLAWSLVHGLASLWLDGSLPAQELKRPPEAVSKAVLAIFGKLLGSSA
jgi:AcrR family transcriptional regulator